LSVIKIKCGFDFINSDMLSPVSTVYLSFIFNFLTSERERERERENHNYYSDLQAI